MKTITKIKVIISTLICLYLCLNLYSCDAPDSKDAEECLNATLDNLVIVAEFLVDYEYDDIYITPDDGAMTLLLKGEEEISNQTVVDAIKALYNDGFETISKSKENNAIRFLRWSRIDDFSAGLVYAIDKSFEPSVSYQTELIPLSEDGWYYYKVDYDELRINNR